MSALRLYAPALVMFAWALVGAISVQGALLNAIGVVSILVAVYLHVTELSHRKDHRDLLP